MRATSWSPDGTRLAIASKITDDAHPDVPPAGAIVFMDVSGRRIGEVRTPLIGKVSPSWSPAGNLLAFTISAADASNSDIYLMDAATGAFSPLII